MTKLAHVLTIVLFTLISCKKDKLVGDAKALSGTWLWSSTITEFSTITPANSGISKTIEFFANGKYEITSNSKRLEGGRIVYAELKNPMGTCFQLEFLRNTLFSKKREFPGKSLITAIGTDTLYISENTDATDQPWHIYVRHN